MLASQRLVILWNLLLQFNLTKGGIPEMNLSVKPFHYSSTSQKVASQSLVLLWNHLLWLNLTKGGIPEIRFIEKPFTVVQPHKNMHFRDYSSCKTFYNGSTSQKDAFQRLVFL